jgi:hypothetical protein
MLLDTDRQAEINNVASRGTGTAGSVGSAWRLGSCGTGSYALAQFWNKYLALRVLPHFFYRIFSLFLEKMMFDNFLSEFT